MNICGEWDEERTDFIGLRAKCGDPFQKKKEEKEITSSKLREMIADEEEWKTYVPKKQCVIYS